MLRMKPYSPSSRIAVRDSIDEELSDDIDDDVFIRDGKLHSSEEKGLKRPLMASRHHNGSAAARASRTKKTVAAILRQRNRCWRVCEPFCYALAALLVLVALIFLAAFFFTMFPVALQKIKVLIRDSNFISHSFGSRYGADVSMDFSEMFSNELTPCTQLSINKIWSKGFSRLSTESQMRKVDLSGDNIDDVIFGYGIDDSVRYADNSMQKCEVERVNGYREMVQCRGGLLAMDGVNGETLWQRWTSFIVFSVYCKIDINGDAIVDCIASGHGGIIVALNGKNGDLLWKFDGEMAEAQQGIGVLTHAIDLYTINGIRDVDGDGFADVIASSIEEKRLQIHDSPVTRGRIVLLSGRNGQLIRLIDSPFREEIYVPLQVVTQFDGNEMILISTGGQSTPGGIYLMQLNTLMDVSKQNEFMTIYRNPTSGFMVPPVLSDLNEDGVDDIIVASFNSTVFAFDGRNHSILWNYSFAESETISSIVPGYYNHDNVTDFMVKYNSGPGFPIYYYSQTQIIDGRNGSVLLDNAIDDAGGSNSLLAGLSVSQAYGGDFFLHWQTQCRDKINVKEPYQFIPDSDIMLQTRADTCQLRYNASTVLKLHALSRHVEPPGTLIMTTDDLLLQLNQTELKQIEQQMTAAISPFKHPKLFRKIQQAAAAAKNSTAAPTTTSTTTAQPNSMPAAVSRFRMKTKQDKPKIHKKILKEENSNENMEKPLFNEQTNEMDVPLSPEIIEAKLKQPNRDQVLKEYIIESINENRNWLQEQMQEKLQEQIQEQQAEAAAAAATQDELPSYYDDPSEGRRMAYEINNRDVRSDSNAENDIESDIVKPELIEQATDDKSNGQKKLPDTLWDLEIEKEKVDAKKENYDDENDRRRRQSFDLPLINQNLLAFVTSPGVLLASIENKSSSSVDMIFILNVRESELFPPLLLAQDIQCVQRRLSEYQSDISMAYEKSNLAVMEKIYLKQCIEQRLPNLSPHETKFIPQIIVTRISIQCTCDPLKTGEKCSTLNGIDRQKWTEFMGNLNNGVF